METIYFDNNATTRAAKEVVDKMLPFFSDLYGNPSSTYDLGAQAADEVDKARSRVARLLNSEKEEIIFTSCGSESDNTAIMSAATAFPEKKHIIISNIEHPAIRNPVFFLEKNGYRVSRLKINENGMFDPDELEKIITKETLIISIMWANNETGTILPIKKTSEIAHEHGVLFHTDAVQVIGKMPIDLKLFKDVDMLSLSGHKFHGPKGIGALFVRKGIKFSPLLHGGGQENNRRAGTENVPGIVGLGMAAQLTLEELKNDIKKISALRDALEQNIKENISQIKINGSMKNRLPNTLNISFKGIEGEALHDMLSAKGIYVSTGSACHSGAGSPSHVLTAMGIDSKTAGSSIRFSLGRYNTIKEVETVSSQLQEAVSALRKMSPFKS